MKEDYVSFEIAKILKEKGFREDCKCQYGRSGSISWTSCNNGNVTTFARPTLQMAMKWLREVHKIIISFNASFVNSIEQHFSWNIRINSLKSLSDEEHFEPFYINTKSEVFEEACEEAIKHCLTNLI